MSGENRIVLRRSFFIVIMSLAFMLLFAQYVHAEPDDDTYVFVTKGGIVWHKYRDCKEIANKKAWVMTYGQARRLSRIDGECETCAKEGGRSKSVTAGTYLYSGSFSEKDEVDWKSYAGSDSKTDTLDLTDSKLEADTSNKSTTGDSSKSTTSDSSKSSSTSDSTSKTTTRKTAAAASSSDDSSQAAATAKSSKTTGSSSGVKELMTDKQRKSRFRSKTNPKKGASPKTPARPKSAGFSYADFGKYNSYNSENGLGGTPIYLLGTIMDMQPVKQAGEEYQVAVMVNDCDNYQWYMRCKCDKSKYELMKKELLGKSAYIYGTYSGYSGITNRPMMDMESVFEVGGKSFYMSIYE